MKIVLTIAALALLLPAACSTDTPMNSAMFSKISCDNGSPAPKKRTPKPCPVTVAKAEAQAK